MKLFQIEEPDGAPLDSDELGAAVGIDIEAGVGRVAIAVGGNAEILPDADGNRILRASSKQVPLAALLLGLRSQAEKQLARPVTHAVIVAARGKHATLERAAEAAGIAILKLIEREAAAALAKGAAAAEAPVLGAAISAEDLAPQPA